MAERVFAAKLLMDGDMNFDELIRGTGLSTADLGMILTDMEMEGLIEALPGKVYTWL